jgi:hypothetical protein
MTSVAQPKTMLTEGAGADWKRVQVAGQRMIRVGLAAGAGSTS